MSSVSEIGNKRFNKTGVAHAELRNTENALF